MCGIAGLVNLRPEPADGALLEQMAERIRHRGPDARSVKTLGPVGLAHARLAIIDLEGGAQPMSNEDGTVWITFSGEILNYVELRDQLIAEGHRFATRSDTEVIVHAWEKWGADCVERFNGQWAFALWDERRETLFLSRDRFGIRPLYWTQTPECFVFGSEVKSIFCHPAIPREVDREGLDQILTFWSTVAPRTFWKGIHDLPPGHSLLLRRGDVHVARYWSLEYAPDPSRSEDDWADEVRALLVDAVRLRVLRADVPVGAYLSGGLDSTTLTAVIHAHTDAPLTTFSVAFEQADFDESRYQAEAVRHLGLADHHSTLCRDEDIGRVFPEVIWHVEQPIVRTAPAPLYLLAGLVRESGYRVVLTGEGADELFGGYDLFKEDKVRRFCARRPGSRFRPLLFRRLYPYLTQLQKQPPSYVEAFFRARTEDLQSPYFSHLPRWELTSRAKLFYSDAVRRELDGRDPYSAIGATLPRGYSDWDSFCRAQWLETTYLLSGYLLSSQGDRMAMAHGVEGRFPFLDVRLAELAARIPPHLKMRALNEKYILKKAAADLIPPYLFKRPKQPYRAPDAACFFDAAGAPRFEWVAELLSPRAIAASGLFDAGAVGRLVDKVRTPGGVTSARDGMALVAILSAQLAVEQLVHHPGRVESA